jgi:hypothetical protein
LQNNKEELIEEIKVLISSDGSSVDINPAFLEYFELEELVDIRDQLLKSKKNDNKGLLDEIYERNKEDY